MIDPPRLFARVGGLLLVAVPCCVSVLDLNDYGDAIVELCKCDMDVPQFGGDCVTKLRDRLDNVSEPARETWLTYYATECDGRCANAFDCFQNVGTCAQRSCEEDRECCDYADVGGNRCVGGQCQTCRALGAPCSRDGECCDQGAGAECLGTCELATSGNATSSSSGGGPDDMTQRSR